MGQGKTFGFVKKKDKAKEGLDGFYLWENTVYFGKFNKEIATKYTAVNLSSGVVIEYKF